MRKRLLILTITDTWMGTVRRVRLQGVAGVPLSAGERVAKITLARRIPIRQLGLNTGQVVIVRRVRGKGVPLRIEVKHYE